MNLLNTTKRMLVVTLLFVAVSGSTYAAASALRRTGPVVYGAALAALGALAMDEHHARTTTPHVVHQHGSCKHFEKSAAGTLVVQGHATRDEQAVCERNRRPLPRVGL